MGLLLLLGSSLAAAAQPTTVAIPNVIPPPLRPNPLITLDAGALPPAFHHAAAQSTFANSLTVCNDAEHQYAALQDVVFSLNASQHPLIPCASQPDCTFYINSTTTDSASDCNQRCMGARAEGWRNASGQPLTCNLWRYCSSPSGCDSSLQDAARRMSRNECQLQSCFLLGEGFSEEPYLQLGGRLIKGINVTVPDTLYGTPIKRSPIMA